MWNVSLVSKKLIATILLASTFIGFLSYNFYHIFYKYQSDVDQILAEIPVEDKKLPPNVLKVFRNTRKVNNIQRFTTTNLRISAIEKHGGISKLEWLLFGFAWEKLLAIRIGEKELFAFYAHKVYFGKHKASNEIVGFKNAAQFYFKKDWQNLNEEEILVLLTIANYPSSFSPHNKSEIFNKKLDEFVETYQKDSKSSW